LNNVLSKTRDRWLLFFLICFLANWNLVLACLTQFKLQRTCTCIFFDLFLLYIYSVCSLRISFFDSFQIYCAKLACRWRHIEFPGIFLHTLLYLVRIVEMKILERNFQQASPRVGGFDFLPFNTRLRELSIGHLLVLFGPGISSCETIYDARSPLSPFCWFCLSCLVSTHSSVHASFFKLNFSFRSCKCVTVVRAVSDQLFICV
jgi:hypothetical protein